MVLQFFLLVENMAFVSFFHTDALKLGKDSHGEETGAQLTSCSLFLFLYFTYYQELAESIDWNAAWPQAHEQTFNIAYDLLLAVVLHINIPDKSCYLGEKMALKTHLSATLVVKSGNVLHLWCQVNAINYLGC